MATILNNIEDEEKDQPSAGASLASPLAAPSSPLAQGQPQAQPANAPRQGSSNRPNINQYIKANEGAGQQIAGGIQNQAQEQASKLGQSVNTSRSQIEAQVNPLSQQLGDQGTQKIQTAFKDPSAILQNQQELQNFQKLRDKGYTQDIQGIQTAGQQQIGQLNQQVGKLDQQAQMAGNETGRFELLRTAFGQPTYSRGQQRLDQLLLQASPAARSLQQGLQGIKNTAGKQVDQFGNEIKTMTEQLTGMAGQRAQDIQNLFSKGFDETGLDEPINARGFDDIKMSSEAKLAQAQQAVAQVPGLRQRLANNTLTAADMQALGLQANQKIYNADLNSFISQNDRTPDLAGVADPTEFARYKALMELSQAQVPNIFGEAAEAGTFNPYEFDSAGLAAKIAAQEKRAGELAAGMAEDIAPWQAFYQNRTNADEEMRKILADYATNPNVDTLKALTDFRFNRPGTIWHNLNLQQASQRETHTSADMKAKLANLFKNAPEYLALNPERTLQQQLLEQEGNTGSGISSTFGVE